MKGTCYHLFNPSHISFLSLAGPLDYPEVLEVGNNYRLLNFLDELEVFAAHEVNDDNPIGK